MDPKFYLGISIDRPRTAALLILGGGRYIFVLYTFGIQYYILIVVGVAGGPPPFPFRSMMINNNAIIIPYNAIMRIGFLKKSTILQ